MHIYSVNDPEFKSYGNVWDDVPSELTLLVLEALSATPIPEGSKYVASAPELESVKGADKLGFLMFGGRPFQLGWCNGHNTQLNCLEYHRAQCERGGYLLSYRVVFCIQSKLGLKA